MFWVLEGTAGGSGGEGLTGSQGASSVLPIAAWELHSGSQQGRRAVCAASLRRIGGRAHDRQGPLGAPLPRPRTWSAHGIV